MDEEVRKHVINLKLVVVNESSYEDLWLELWDGDTYIDRVKSCEAILETLENYIFQNVNFSYPYM